MKYVFRQHEAGFKKWKETGHPNVKAETKIFIENILNSNKKRTMWKHQIDSILRTIYAYEVLGMKNLLLNIVTGGGKTAIIASIIFWLKAVHGINKFLILAPNTIVRDRLQFDFEGGKIFHDFELNDGFDETIINGLSLHVMEPGNQPVGMVGAGIILGNVQQLYTIHTTGKRNLAYIQNFVGSVAIFNDEAHNTPALEYSNILNMLSKKCVLRLDTTATPDRADAQEPDTEMIQHYDITNALKDGIIKSVVVYEPNSRVIEMCYTNPETKERRKITELDAEFESVKDGLGKFHWILDPEPMKKQMAIALKRHEEHKIRAKGRYKPILFVVTMSIEEGEIARKMLQERFNVNTLLVTEESDEKDRDEALKVGTFDSKYEAVVSVLMLREGWDVPQVSTILLLRKFSSPVYGQQVIGRGLRKILRNPNEPEILSVIDHPRLEHEWLWKLVAVSKIRKDVGDEDVYDPNEDLPQSPKIPILVKPENIITVPSPTYEIPKTPNPDDIEDDKVEHDWRRELASISYEKESIRITRTDIPEITVKQLEDRGLEIIDGVDENDIRVSGQLPRSTLEFLLKKDMQESCERLLNEAGYSPALLPKLYKVMNEHVQNKIFGDVLMSNATTEEIGFAIHVMPQIRKAFTKPIIAGIVEDKK